MIVEQLVAGALAVGTALAVDRLTAHRGFDPPGFRDPLRRTLAGAGLSLIFFLGIFSPAMTFGQTPELDIESLSSWQVFILPALLLGCVAAWYHLGFAIAPRTATPRDEPLWMGQFGLRVQNVASELSIGLAVGVVAWFGVLLAALGLGMVLSGLSDGQAALAQEPPQLIVWMAALPVAMRLAISLSAGVVEEIFFRGFLQPRVGVPLSTLLFVGAHLGYGQPLMLFGVTLLSLVYAALVLWRRSVWAAIAAHFLFDAVQLLVVIPGVLQAYEKGAFSLVAWAT